jgi:hypothetical protein
LSGNRNQDQVEVVANSNINTLLNDVSSLPPPPPYTYSLGQKSISQPPKYEDVTKNALINNNNNNVIIHFVKKEDTLVGLSFKYGVEIKDIRKANLFFDDNIFARKFLKIPKYIGPSLSEKPSVEDELKTFIKRFQLKSKCVDYDEAKYYMEQSDYDIESAIKLYRDDVLWEMQHPRPSNKINKKKIFNKNDIDTNNKLKIQ